MLHDDIICSSIGLHIFFNYLSTIHFTKVHISLHIKSMAHGINLSRVDEFKDAIKSLFRNCIKQADVVAKMEVFVHPKVWKLIWRKMWWGEENPEYYDDFICSSIGLRIFFYFLSTIQFYTGSNFTTYQKHGSWQH